MDFNTLENLRTKVDLSTVGKPALIGLALLIVMVAATAGRFAIDAATATEIPIAHSSQPETAPSEQLQSESANRNAPAELPEVIYVHVSGAVRKSGLVELESGSRVADAIKAAGGPTEDACIDTVNLARKVEDGEHVHLPSNEEDEQGSAPLQALAQDKNSPITGMVNINNASSDELEQLPGIGPSTAQKIISNRESEGPYEDIEDLKRVPGIGDKKFAALEDLICV